jgi:hypothetical protein
VTSTPLAVITFETDSMRAEAGASWAQSGEEHRGVGNRRVLGGFSDHRALIGNLSSLDQLAGAQMSPGKEVQCGLQMHKGACLACEANLADGQCVPGLIVPQLESNDAAGPGSGAPQPAADLVRSDVQRKEQCQRFGQRRRRGHIAVGQAHRECVE